MKSKTRLSKLFYKCVGGCLAFTFAATLAHGFEKQDLEKKSTSGDFSLESPELEGRARVITSDLMCPVCSGQSVDESDAELAHDIRRAVRDRVQAGDTDAEVRDWLRSRYGEEIFMTPVVEAHTFVLWGGPILFLIIGMALLFGRHRSYRKLEAKDV